MSQFTHLHLHTEYSLLDGANKLKELAKTLKEQGATSVAMTDHGNMFGAIDFYQTMRSEGLKPIIGLEAYLHNHEDISDKSSRQRFHLCLYAKNSYFILCVLKAIQTATRLEPKNSRQTGSFHLQELRLS